MPKLSVHLLGVLAMVSSAGCAAGGPVKHDPWPEDDLHNEAVRLKLDQEVYDRVGPSDQDQRDWKSFRLKRPERLRVALRLLTEERRLAVVVYKANGETLGSLLGQTGAEQSLTLQVDSGLYYIEVTPEDESVVIDYALLVEAF
jgi:hypothetical protein